MRKCIVLSGLFLAACTATQSSGVDGTTLLDGTPATIEQLAAGRPAIVNFWASWCSFCKEELPIFQRVHEEYPEIAMIGVNLQEKPGTARAYWDDGGYTFPSLLDPDRELKSQFDVFTQPTTFVLDAGGDIVFRKDGPVTEEEIEELEVIEEIEDERVRREIGDSGQQSSISSISSFRTSPVPPHLRSWYSGTVKHTIPLEEILSGGPGKDGIPAVDDPKFVEVESVNFLEDDSVGLLLNLGGDARFYPFAILNWHEVVNDTVAGTHVAVTYCPLCASAVVYDREISTGLTTFGVSGMLYNSNLLMYDRATGSLWNQITGKASVGPLTGEKLQLIPSNIVRFSTVEKEYFNAKVLSTDTGHSRDYRRDPYGGYESEERVMFPLSNRDARLPNKELVYGIVIEGAAKAYTKEAIEREGTIEDRIGSVAIRIEFNPATESIVIIRTDTNEEIVPMPSFWFSWAAQYPETGLYGR